MALDAKPLLRPAWVLHIARAANAFVLSQPTDGATGPSVDVFLRSLPPPTAQLERRVLCALRDELQATPAVAGHYARGEHAQLLLDSDYRRAWTLRSLARAVGCNRTTLQQEFQHVAGTSVHRYLIHCRVDAARRLLVDSDVKASRVCREVGCRSASAFGRHFKRITGSTLSAYRERAHRGVADRDAVPADRTQVLR